MLCSNLRCPGISAHESAIVEGAAVAVRVELGKLLLQLADGRRVKPAGGQTFLYYVIL